jgi:transcriptional regulator with XRE-family HTH domain
MITDEKYKADIRFLRQRVRLTLHEVATAIGTTDTSISRWELGTLDLKLKIDQVEELLKLYKISFQELTEAWKNTEKKLPKTEVVEFAERLEMLQSN